MDTPYSARPETLEDKVRAVRALIASETDPVKRRRLQDDLGAVYLSGAMAAISDDGKQPAHRFDIPARGYAADPEDVRIAIIGRTDVPDDSDDSDDSTTKASPSEVTSTGAGWLRGPNKPVDSYSGSNVEHLQVTPLLSLITTAIEQTNGVPLKRTLRLSDKITDLGLGSLDVQELTLRIDAALNTNTPGGAEFTWITVEDVVNTYKALHRS